MNNIMDAFAPIKSHPVDFYPDPSIEGWKGTGRKFEEDEMNLKKEYHIKLLAAFFCLKSFCILKTGLKVLLKVDSTTAVAYINKKAGQFQMHATIWQNKSGPRPQKRYFQ